VTADAFHQVAPYYDELMKPVPYRMWTAYYLLLLAHQGIKIRNVLDVACGTGTMCELLTEEGFQMTGVDISADMIERARKKATKKKLPIRYEVADACTMKLGGMFEGALSFFDSLNNIVDPTDLERAFQRVAAHLPPGGSFIFDLNTPYAFEAKLFDQENLKPSAKLRYKWVGDWNPDTKIIRVDMQFWRKDQHFEETHIQRAYEQEEVEPMLERAGFGQIRAFHSYTLNPPRYKSDRIHYACIRM
jgi:ubiquinone/menaquinone biosynthesis C-methylase UbiE